MNERKEWAKPHRVRTRICPGQERGRKLTDSITHSVPANNTVTLANPFPLLHIPRPISAKISLAFAVVEIAPMACCCCRMRGSSYANEEDISEMKAPIPKPTVRKCHQHKAYKEWATIITRREGGQAQYAPMPAAMTVFAMQDSIPVCMKFCILLF